MKKRIACFEKKLLTVISRGICVGLLSATVFLIPGALPALAAPGLSGNYFPELSTDDATADLDLQVHGIVRDENGVPLPGASVIVKKSRIATVTDSKGEFSLKVPSPESVLVISFTGFETIEMRVGNQAELDIRLTVRAATAGDSVVVIGYGTSRKSDLTGSVGAVKESQLKERPAVSLAQGLAGRIAGPIRGAAHLGLQS